MTEPRPSAQAEHQPDPSTEGTGLYLYGIGLVPEDVEVDDLERVAEQRGLRTHTVERLVAFTKEVPRSEYSQEAIQARAEDQEWLLRIVQEHHQVVAQLSQALALLPATFGTLYETEASVLEALRDDKDSLTQRLQRIDGCEEWALHVFREESGIREHLVSSDPELRRMSAELDEAAPGRAYLLRQQLEKRLSRLVEDQQLAIADSLLDRLREFVREIQIDEPRSADDAGPDDTEIARASLLVRRDQSEAFLDALDRMAEGTPGVRVEVSGPWPVYSFTQIESGHP